MSYNQFIEDIKQILAQARQKAYSATNFAMVEAYWLVGKRIVEQEQEGEERAKYGAEIIKSLSIELSNSLGRGFSETNIRNFRLFYLNFPDFSSIQQTLSAKLSWSHFQLLMRVPDTNARQYYLKEAAEQNWSVRTLERNIDTLYYQRLISSQISQEVELEMKEKTKDFQQDSYEFIKNPTVLEFLNIPVKYAYTENQLEQALIDNLQNFMLELGKGFAFVARQKHVRTETADFFIDLVFYNYILKCFVIIELKTNKLTHQDIGQLDMYVRMFDDLEKRIGDNPTIGILLCTETDRTIAKYSVLNDNKQLFANKYLPYLPSEKELEQEIERERRIFKQRIIDNETL